MRNGSARLARKDQEAKWSIETAPPMTDPLYYYSQNGSPADGIAFEVLPLYEEDDARCVEVSIYSSDRSREALLGDSDCEQLYGRALSTLARWHRGWRHITLKADDLPRILDSGVVAREMQRRGFELRWDPSADNAVFSRKGR
jgi:hypothetical protein